MLIAKKSLGQHFLKEPKYLNKIVESAGVTATDIVLEIGPGEGALTRALLATQCHVVAIELDDRAIPLLQETFSSEIATGRLKLFHADITDGLSDDMLQALRNQNGDLNYKLVANIPYYITGLIIRQFLETDHQPHLMTLLIQREVAERIVTRDGKESLLSLSVKAYGTPTLNCRVPAGAFTPPPKVDSAIITINGITRSNFAHHEHEGLFFTVLKTAFAQKRKTIGSTLAHYPNVLAQLATRGYTPKARPEDIKIEDWVYGTTHL
jgi:16S rRNA (adenine1518-N6/adenine1519-N6)-dimethyltransferase